MLGYKSVQETQAMETLWVNVEFFKECAMNLQKGDQLLSRDLVSNFKVVQTPTNTSIEARLVHFPLQWKILSMHCPSVQMGSLAVVVYTVSGTILLYASSLW